MLTIISCSDELDNVVQVSEGCQESLYQVQPLLSLGQVEARPPLNHIAPAAAPCMHQPKLLLCLAAVQSKLDVERILSVWPICLLKAMLSAPAMPVRAHKAVLESKSWSRHKPAIYNC